MEKNQSNRLEIAIGGLMRIGNILFSAVHFFVVFFILGMGIFFFVLPYADGFRTKLVQVLLDGKRSLFWIGGISLGLGILLFLAAFLLNRRQYLQMESIRIDKKVVQKCTEAYFQEQFPGFSLVSDVVIRGRSMIEIITSLPSPQEEEFFDKIESELGDLLARRLGYQEPFTITFVES